MASEGVDTEIVVVDNASSDGTADLIRRDYPHVQLIANPKNIGLAAANNQGIAATSAPYVVMCNPDIEVRADALESLVSCFGGHPRAALIGPRMYDGAGRLRSTVADLPRLRDALRGRYWWGWWDHEQERQVGQVIEACYAVRRTAVESVGGLDPRYFLYWEGCDWAHRFRDGGWETWFCPSAEATHAGGGTVEKISLRRILLSHRSAYRYFRLHSRVPMPLLMLVFTARAVVKLVVQAVTGTDSQTPLVKV
jgi:GT2 family glycosyltransferase